MGVNHEFPGVGTGNSERFRGLDTNPYYEPIGVWVQGPGPGLDIVMEYLPGNDEFQEDADWVINRLVENEVKSLPDDFLEYHRSTMSPYSGMRGEIVETEEYATAEDCAAGVTPLRAGK